jgi:hypothetical protein
MPFEVSLTKARRVAGGRPTDRFARRLQLAFRRAAEKMRAITTDVELVRALESRNSMPVITDARWRTIDFELLVDLDEALREEVGVAGEAELRRVVAEFGTRKARRPAISVRFDLRNPFTEDYVRRKSAELVRGISDRARMQIRDQIEEGFVSGVPVRTTARAIRNGIGLDPRLAQAVRSRAEALAIAGTAEDVAERLVERYADGLLSYRAETIARTETINASNQGVMDSWKQAEREELLPKGMKKRWIAALGSARTCPICEELGESDPIPIDEDFYSTVLGASIARPAAHVSCRCTLGLVRP